MSSQSSIEWTNATWNPITGCTKVSAGCKNCYAERFAERFRGVKGHPYEQGFDLKLWPERLELPLTWKRPMYIFVNSMSDLFHEDIPISYIRKVFRTMERTPWHRYQILTKRAKRVAEVSSKLPWPANVWQGVSVEDMRVAERVDHLRKVGAAVRFLSCEPLLGPLHDLNLQGIHWVIVGGESGPGARPMDPAWVRGIARKCEDEGIPFFFKQWGGVHKKVAGRLLDGRTWDDMPRPLEVPA